MQTIGGYVVIEELARGGQGVVYRARQGDREVAIKLLLAGAAATEAQRRRFQTEIQAMAQLRHPGIVSVHAAGEHQGAPYYVMDLVQGESLAHVLRREGRLDSERAGEVVLALSEALATAHAAGILHRDLKPDNVLIDESGRPRLTDFGLALQLESDRMTRSGQLLGTPGYWAPEQAGGATSKVGTTTDVYGLGATLYALLTGAPPFAGHGLDELVAATVGRKPKRPSEIVADVDRRLEEICLRCLEKDPGRRFGSASELAAALSDWRVGEDYTRAPWVRLPLHRPRPHRGTPGWALVRLARADAGEHPHTVSDPRTTSCAGANCGEAAAAAALAPRRRAAGALHAAVPEPHARG